MKRKITIVNTYEPLVSIVMPAYNVELYIGKSIESVISQTYDNWELIIINDGSNDNTKKQANIYKDSRITIYSQENQGVSVARNEGLKRIRGEFVAFLDADDLYSPFFLEKLLHNIIIENADMSFSKHRKVRGDIVLEQTPIDILSMPEDNFIKYLLEVKNNAYAVMATLYRTDVIKKHDIFFTENCTFGEDFEFVLKVASQGKVSFHPEYLYTYIYRSDSASHQDLTYKHIIDHINAYARVGDYIKGKGGRDAFLYLKYIRQVKNGTLINFRRKLWEDLKVGNFDEVENQLLVYGQKLYHPSRNFFQKIGNIIKLSIINSDNRFFWKIVNFLSKK